MRREWQWYGGPCGKRMASMAPSRVPQLFQAFTLFILNQMVTQYTPKQRDQGGGYSIPAAMDDETRRRPQCRALGGRKSTASKLYATSGRSCAMRAALQMSRLDSSTKRAPRLNVDSDAATIPGAEGVVKSRVWVRVRVPTLSLSASCYRQHIM